MLPNAFRLPLEPTRIAEYFPAVNAEGQSISFLQHSGSSLATSGAGMSVAENADKPELGMSLTAHTIPFSVVAAIETISKQMWTDFESVAEFLPRAISNQVIQGENYQIISGSGTAPDQTGLLNTTGVLTKAFATGGSDTEIDTILEAATAIRVGPAFGNADLLILNPQDWLSLRQIKTSFDSYVLKQNDPGELGGIDHLFQLRVAQTTSMPQGTALVLDSSIAVNIFRRWGLTVEVNPWAGNEFRRTSCSSALNTARRRRHLSQGHLQGDQLVPGQLMITDDNENTSVKVRVSGPWQVQHEGNLFYEGQEATVPQHVAQLWERSRLVERVAKKAAPKKTTA